MRFCTKMNTTLITIQTEEIFLVLKNKVMKRKDAPQIHKIKFSKKINIFKSVIRIIKFLNSTGLKMKKKKKQHWIFKNIRINKIMKYKIYQVYNRLRKTKKKFII